MAKMVFGDKQHCAAIREMEAMAARGLRLKEIGIDPDNPHRAFVKLKDLDGRWGLTEVIAHKPIAHDPKSVYWDTGPLGGVLADEYLDVCKQIATVWH